MRSVFCKTFIEFIIVCACCSLAVAQDNHVSGFVTDAQSGEAIVGASIVANTVRRGTITNQHGYFSLWIPKGIKHLMVSSIGYHSYQMAILPKQDSVLVLKLRPQVVELKEATVITNQSEQINLSPGAISISVRQLKKVPALLGEADILKALALTPGVNTGTEGTAGLLIRGGTPDQNLIMLDGAPVYNVSHLFGLVSVFNADAIKNVDLYKGGFPARYGGRLSSVIDVTMKEGNNQKRSIEGGIGLIGARLLAEGPTHYRLKNKSSFMLAGRISYLTLLLLPSRLLFDRGKATQYTNYNLYDFNGKINYSINKNSRLFASFYMGNDWYRSEDGTGDSKQSFGLGWGNSTATIRYNRVIKPTLFHEAVALFTNYSYWNSSRFSEKIHDKWESISAYKVQSTLQDWAFKNQWIHTSLPNHLIRFGADLTHHTFKPTSTQTSYTMTADTLKSTNLAVRANEIAAYVEDEFKPHSRLTLNAGMRGVLYQVNRVVYPTFEPRLSISLSVNNIWSVETGYSRMNQFIHLLSSSGVGLPNDIWLPVTKRLPPQTSDQVMAGVKANWQSAGWLFSGDVYYKYLKNLTDYQAGANFLANFNTTWEDQIETNGRGTAMGAEGMLRKTKGQLTGWMAYTLSRTTRQFATINDGNIYAAPYDRRHVISLFLDYISEKGSGLSVTWQYHSGDPTTVPVALREDFEKGLPVLLYGSKSNFRMPAYHRLDVVARFVKKRSSGRVRTWTTGFYNIYNRTNPLYLDIKRRYNYAPDTPSLLFATPIGTNFRLVSKSAFQIIPIVSYSYTH